MDDKLNHAERTELVNLRRAMRYYRENNIRLSKGYEVFLLKPTEKNKNALRQLLAVLSKSDDVTAPSNNHIVITVPSTDSVETH